VWSDSFVTQLSAWSDSFVGVKQLSHTHAHYKRLSHTQAHYSHSDFLTHKHSSLTATLYSHSGSLTHKHATLTHMHTTHKHTHLSIQQRRVVVAIEFLLETFHQTDLYEWVMSHIWINHVSHTNFSSNLPPDLPVRTSSATYMNKSCDIYELILCGINHVTHTNFSSKLSTRHMNKSC